MVALYQKKINQYEMTAQTTVIEFFNGGSDKTFFDTIRKTGTENLNRFVSDIWPSLQHNRYIRHEEFDYCLVDDTRVLLKVDYISQEPNGTLVITDWKTGIEQEENSINKLQMQVYALWAGKYFQKDITDIRCELAYLKTGSIIPYTCTVDDLQELQILITGEFRDMNRTYDSEEYPPKPGLFTCNDCAFKTICPGIKM
jgi:CRISPR/Cas system-associated exonuclease Cas4 (RecB family)